ncbi:MAG: type II secretion system protein N [Bdellovibrionota bacterium]
MLGKISIKDENLNFLLGLPWKGMVIVLSLAFASATILSIFIGKFILPNQSIKRTTVQQNSVFTPALQASLNRTEIKSIVTRNIFNAEGKTGEETPDPNAVKKNLGGDAVETTLPLKLQGVIFGGDPNSGIALVEDTTQKSINSFMVGDTIASAATVMQIFEDRIIIDHDGSKEFLKLIQPELVRTRRKKTAANKSVKSGLSPIAVKPPPDTYKEEGFERSKEKIVMSSSFKQRMLSGDFAKVLQDAKAEPNMVGKELVGFRLTRIRQDSIYEKSGLRNGDIITEVNGIPLSDTGQAINTLRSLKNESFIEIRVNRNGSFFNISIEVR